MIIEIQIRAELLRRIVRNRFLAQAICVPDLPGPGQKVLDHLEFGQVTLTREADDMPVRLADGDSSSVPGHRVRVTQPVIVFIATHAQIVAGGAQGPQSFSQSVPIDLFFDFTGDLQVDDDNQVTGAAVNLTYAGNNLPPGALPSDVQAALDEVLQQVQQSAPLDLGPLAAALQTTITPGNVGVATDTAGTRVAIRLELAPVAGNPTAAWASFYSSVSDRLMGRDWSVLVDAAILTQTIGTQFAEQLSGSSSKFELTSGPSVTWQPWLPGVQIYFEGNITDVCDFTSIEVEVTAHTTFSVEQGTPPRLKASTHLTWDLVDSDVFLCGLEAALFTGTFGAVIGAGGGGIGAAIGAVVGIVVGIVGVAIFAGTADASKLPDIQPQGCQQTSPEDADYLDVVCRRDLNPVDVALLGSLAPDQLAGTGPGLLLLGGAEVPQWEDQFTTKLTPFSWTQDLNCNTKNVDIELEGRVQNSNGAGIGWQLCDVHIEDDALGFFHPSYSNANEIKIWLDYGLWDTYFANPYPCHLYVRASCGARWYDFGTIAKPPEPPSQVEVLIAWATYCSPAYNDYWGGRNNPHWLIDPDPPWELTLHRWDVVATGLLENDVSVLADAEGHILARAVANAAGHVVHSSVLTPAVSEGGLQLGHQAAAGQANIAQAGAAAQRDDPPADGRLLITQTLLGQQASFAMSGPVRAFAFPGGSRSGRFAAVTSTGLHVYALPAPNLRGAHLVSQLLDSGLRGVAALSSGLLLAGDGGVVYRPLSASGRLGRPRVILAAPARAATALRGIGCVLVERGVQVIDPALRARALLTVDGAEAVGTLSGHLAVLEAHGRLALFDLGKASDTMPRLLGRIDLPAWMKFRGDALVGSLEAPDTVTLPGGAKVAVQREGWLADAWRLPGQYVHIDTTRGRATVFMVRRRRQTWKSIYRPPGRERPDPVGAAAQRSHSTAKKR